MKFQILADTFSSELFNRLAMHPMQTWEWGEARKKMGLQVVRIGEFEKSTLKRVYQMTIHPIPYTRYKIGYIPRSLSPTSEFLEYLSGFNKENKIAFIKFEPNQEEDTRYKIQDTNLKRSPYTLFPNWTIKLDLTLSEEKLLKQMKPKTRYNIRLAQKKGVIVKEMTNYKGFEIFIKLYFETMKRQKYFGHDYSYHRILFNELKNKYASILVAFYNNTPLAVYELFHFKTTLYYPYGGSSEFNQNFMGNNLLMWKAIRFGKQKGFKTFDMWGSLPPDYKQTDLWAGFTRFKEGYGGRFVEMTGTFDLVVNPVVYYSFNAVQYLRNLLMLL